MPQTALLQDLIANLDLHLPWLLPVMEAIELTVPSPVRLVICLALMGWLAVIKQRSATSTGGLQRVTTTRSST